MLRTRIAPTPSGFLHLGNALNFALSSKLCRGRSGRLLLRIDDLDFDRCRPEFIDDVFDCLSFLQIEPDEGPKNREDFLNNFSERLRQELYWNYAKNLLLNHKAYVCNCSRSQRERFNAQGAYQGNCRSLGLKFTPGQSCLRLDCSCLDGSSPWLQSLNDFVIWTKEGHAAYQLVSVVEDYNSKINFIVRGEDLYDSSQAQCFLATRLGPDFERAFRDIEFIHHPLYRSSADVKLSKSRGDLSLKEMIRSGYTLQDFEKNFADFFGDLRSQPWMTPA